MENNRNIGDNIREASRKIGGQVRLSEITGIKKSTLSDYIRGRTEPKASALRAISEACDVTSDWLLFGEGGSETSDNDNPGQPMDKYDFLDIARDQVNDYIVKIKEEYPEANFTPTLRHEMVMAQLDQIIKANKKS